VKCLHPLFKECFGFGKKSSATPSERKYGETKFGGTQNRFLDLITILVSSMLGKDLCTYLLLTHILLEI
jgi:hypothetical protein